MTNKGVKVVSASAVHPYACSIVVEDPKKKSSRY